MCNRVPTRLRESQDFVYYRGFVGEYPINFRVNKNTLLVEACLSDLMEAYAGTNGKTVSDILLADEGIMNEFLDLMNVSHD